MISKGTYVEICQIVLELEDRASNIPEDTKQTPLKLWAKGWLMEDQEAGKSASIKTINGRILEGIITEVNPKYDYDFGEFIPELAYIGAQAKGILRGEEL